MARVSAEHYAYGLAALPGKMALNYRRHGVISGKILGMSVFNYAATSADIAVLRHAAGVRRAADDAAQRICSAMLALTSADRNGEYRCWRSLPASFSSRQVDSTDQPRLILSRCAAKCMPSSQRRH